LYFIGNNGETSGYSLLQDDNTDKMITSNATRLFIASLKTLAILKLDYSVNITFYILLNKYNAEKYLKAEPNPLMLKKKHLNKHYRLARLKYLDNRVFLRYCFTCLSVPAATSPTKER
jgi:hypothetical protein